MSWPTSFAVVGCAVALILGLLKIAQMIWGRDIRAACMDRFLAIERKAVDDVAEIDDTSALKRGECMEKFKKLADVAQTNMVNIASLKAEIESMNEKIDELKIDFKKLSEIILKKFIKNK